MQRIVFFFKIQFVRMLSSISINLIIIAVFIW